MTIATGPVPSPSAPEPSPVSALGDLNAREVARSAAVAELLGQRTSLRDAA
jgi:hypothetical protein